MLKQWEKTERPSDAKLEERLQEARRKLQEQQLKVKEHGLPVLVLVEGWGTAGKGSLIGGTDGGRKEKTVFVPPLCKNTGERQVQLFRLWLDG